VGDSMPVRKMNASVKGFPEQIFIGVRSACFNVEFRFACKGVAVSVSTGSYVVAQHLGFGG
jgi:organic hydroperoxide reductase OsmC/OhrA